MPINRDDIEQDNSPVTLPEGDIEERELSMPEPIPEPVPAPPPSGGWDWVGSPSRPEAQEEDDGVLHKV